jgi:hypothetical protein
MQGRPSSRIASARVDSCHRDDFTVYGYLFDNSTFCRVEARPPVPRTLSGVAKLPVAHAAILIIHEDDRAGWSAKRLKDEFSGNRENSGADPPQRSSICRGMNKSPCSFIMSDFHPVQDIGADRRTASLRTAMPQSIGTSSKRSQAPTQMQASRTSQASAWNCWRLALARRGKPLL